MRWGFRGGSCTASGRWRRSRGRRRRRPAGRGISKRLSVQFRGMGVPEHEVLVSGTVRELSDGRALIDTVAEQDGNQIIRNAEAELEL